MILDHLLQRVGQGSDLTARQTGKAEFSVMLDHIQVQGFSTGGFAQEPHVRDLAGVGGFAYDADIIDIKGVMADGQETGWLADFLLVVGGFRHTLSIHGPQHIIDGSVQIRIHLLFQHAT